MKKFLVAFVVLTLTVGFAFAQVGLTADLEFGIFDVNNAKIGELVGKDINAEEYPYLYAGIGYGNTFVDALDFSAGVGVEFGLNQEVVDEKGTEKNPLFLYVDVGLGYSIGLADAATLSINVDSENCIDLYTGAEDNFNGILWPGLTLHLGTDAGGISLTAKVPFGYAGYLENSLGLDVTLGWASTFGLGLSATGHVLLQDETGEYGDKSSDLTGLSFSASYGFDAFSFGVDVTVPLKTVDLTVAGISVGEITLPYSLFDMYAHEGISISPSISYTITEGLDAYAGCTFKYIGLDKHDVGINFKLGVSYSF